MRSGSDTDIETNKTRKRKRNTDQHTRNVIRNSKVRGVSFSNWNGKTVEARKTGPGCLCRMHCFSKFDFDDQVRILDRFNNLKNKNEQDTYNSLLRHLTSNLIDLEKMYQKTDSAIFHTMF